MSEFEKSILICNQPEYIEHYEHITSGISPLYNIIPDRADFRRSIRANRVMCEDHFPKQSRNIDYSGIDTEFFSADHLYYKEDGYKGFSDYSVVGSEYSETGFAPYAVANYWYSSFVQNSISRRSSLPIFPAFDAGFARRS